MGAPGRRVLILELSKSVRLMSPLQRSPTPALAAEHPSTPDLQVQHMAWDALACVEMGQWGIWLQNCDVTLILRRGDMAV
jgi:hypothetical protein